MQLIAIITPLLQKSVMADQERNKRDSLGDGLKDKSISFSMSLLCFCNHSGSEAGWWGWWMWGGVGWTIGILRWRLLCATVTSQYLQIKTQI